MLNSRRELHCHDERHIGTASCRDRGNRIPDHRDWWRDKRRHKSNLHVAKPFPAIAAQIAISAKIDNKICGNGRSAAPVCQK